MGTERFFLIFSGNNKKLQNLIHSNPGQRQFCPDLDVMKHCPLSNHYSVFVIH